MNSFPESARRRLAAEAPGDHPDADLLTAFAEHTLAGAERERVLAHLAGCAACREVVSLTLPNQPEPVEVGAPAAHSWFRWPVLRWTAVAATVIVVGAAVSVLTRRDREVEIAVPAREAPGTAAKAPVTQEAKGYIDRPPARNKEAAPKAGAAFADKQRRQDAPVLDGAKSGVAKSVGERDLREQAQVEPRQQAADQLRAEESKTKLADADNMKADTARQQSASKDAAITQNGIAQGALLGGQAGTAANMAGNYQAQAATSAPAAAAPAPPPAQAQQPTSQNEAVMTIPSNSRDAYTLKSEAGVAKKAAPEVGAATTGGLMKMSRAKSLTVPRWRVSSSGAIERSSDGSAWEKVEIDPAVTFRAISSNDGDLWAGGTGGALFHSADAGHTWSRVKVGEEGMWVSDTITGVNFLSTRGGVVTTQSRAVWMTQDGGRTWQRRQ